MSQPPSLDLLQARLHHLDIEAPAPTATPLVLFAIGLFVFFLLVHHVYGSWPGSGFVAYPSAASLVASTLLLASWFFGLAWLVATTYILQKAILASRRRQAHFDVWASRQSWDVSDWARIAHSPEVPPSLATLARHWLFARFPEWNSVSQVVEEEPVDALPEALKANPSMGAAAWRRVGRGRTWQALLVLLGLGLVAVAWLAHCSPSLAWFAFLVLMTAVFVLAAVMHERAMKTEMDERVESFGLDTTALARAQASARTPGSWRLAIQRHLEKVAPGWSLLPETPLWRSVRVSRSASAVE